MTAAAHTLAGYLATLAFGVLGWWLARDPDHARPAPSYRLWERARETPGEVTGGGVLVFYAAQPGGESLVIETATGWYAAELHPWRGLESARKMWAN